MGNLRFEEYSENVEHYVLRRDLERTAKKFSKESNWHEDIEIELCIDGEGELLVNGEAYHFNKDNFCVINSNQIHHTGTKTRIVYDCLIIKSDFLRNHGIYVENEKFETIFSSDTLKSLFNKLKYENENDSRYKTAKIDILLLEIVLYLIDRHSTAQITHPFNTKYFTRIKEVIRIIRTDYSKKISLNSISKTLHTDKYALCREFKRITGLTMIQYLNSYRCKKAIEHLKNGCTVNEAAYLCGFESTSFFTKTFKTLTGTLPSSYKK